MAKILKQGDDDQVRVSFQIPGPPPSVMCSPRRCGSLPISVRYGGQLCGCTAGDYCSTRDGMVNVSTVKPNNRCLDSKGDEIEDK